MDRNPPAVGRNNTFQTATNQQIDEIKRKPCPFLPPGGLQSSKSLGILLGVLSGYTQRF